MKIAIFGDLHWSSYSSIVRSRGTEFSTRLENLINTMNWVEEMSDKKETDIVVGLGDFFDRPDLTAEEITALQSIAWNYQPHYLLVGNHELGLSTQDYNSSALFGMLPDFTVISNETSIADDTGKTIGFLPYVLECNRQSLNYYDIIFSHNDIKTQYGLYTSSIGYDIDDINTHCQLFINGHLHNHYIDGKIIELGNITGQNFSEDAFRYGHYLMILDTATLTYELIENPYAFNFYKLENPEEIPFELKNNAVVTVKCTCDNIAQLRDIYSNCIASRFVLEHVIDANGKENIDTSLTSIDHLSRFCDYVKEKIGNDSITLAELNAVVEG